MNELIKELAFKAGFVGESMNPIFGTCQETALKNFAELIVRECAAICDSLQDIPATEPRHCAEDIRIYFGVEE